jgi:hypothetical protein
MVLSNIKRIFQNFIATGCKIKNDIYIKFNDDNNPTPMVSFFSQPNYTTSTHPITPVSAIMVPVSELEIESDLKNLDLQNRHKILQGIIGPDIPELTIEHLVQNYNSTEAALNAYLDDL